MAARLLSIRFSLVILAFSIFSLPLTSPAEAQTYRFTNVTVEGATRIEPATILTYAGIAQGETISAGQLNTAYQNVLGSRLFETVEFVPSGNTLIIRVVEYPTVNRINFEGNRRLKNEELSQVVQSQVRRVYSPSIAEQDAARITQAYEQQGRLAASVDPVIIRRSNNRVDLVFEIREGRVSEVERISFVGNRNYSDRRLRRVLESKQAGIFRRIIQRDTFIADRIEFDKQVIRDFYLARGFVDFQVLSATPEFSRERDGFFVTFNVREGQRYSFGEITVTSELGNIDPDEFAREVKIRPGQTYSPNGVDDTIRRLERLAVQKDLDFIRVDPRVTRNDRNLSLDIEFAVVKGPRVFVERIDIEGNATTLDRVVRRQFETVEGDPFNPRQIRDAAERIRALGFFSNAEVNAREGSSPEQVIVDVDVEEQPTGSLGFGASYSASGGVGVNVSFSERNFLGRGQRLQLEFTTTADTGTYGFNFVEPGFLGRNLQFGISASYSETTTATNTSYDTVRGLFSPSLEFPVSENGRLQVRYVLNATEISDVPATSSAILQAEDAVGMQIASGVGYTYSYRTLDTGLNPDAGILFRFGQDFAGLGGDLEYVQTNALLVAERKVLNNDVTLRAVFEGGAHSSLGGDVSRITDRFNLNGKMRGFDSFGIGPRDLGAANQDALGGNYFAVAKFEAEFPLGLPEEYGVRGGVFLDVGSVWGLDNVAGTGGPVDDSLHLRSAAGVSLFRDTPIGPLRFNFSRTLEKQPYDIERDFDLTISTRF
ncbi:Outer membrane protein assembly factor YaeT precursor [Candidatus Rhodobacter oscarellae]|uniref:Outer membrane protein assembly factor BamA n=1 Tax=Candidatus Rhodobacter oscarellae TaxID=1675527 RepID=A0A0J9E3D5_9RHOB|nr:Outer membrane protein assembly factor YaeT precursor [Candidatus Rhodobacter lobularis]